MHLVRTGRGPDRCVSIETLKANLRVQHSSEDELMKLWIGAAEELVEARLNRSIMRQTFELTVDTISPSVTLYRPQYDARPEITKVRIRENGNASDLDIPDPFIAINDMLPVLFLNGVTRARRGSVVVTYEVGATDRSEVPPGIQQAVLLLASNWYRTREAAPTDMRARPPSSLLPFGADALISSFRIPNTNIDPNAISFEERYA